MAKKIGLSVSQCVVSICKGEVSVEDVEKIMAGTLCPNEATWNFVINHYKETCWKEFPDQAEEVVRQLIVSDRILQPRIGDCRKVPNKQNGIWVDSEDQIEYF